MSASVFLLTISLAIATILTVFGMKYLSAAYQARARGASETAYRELAQKAVSLQSETTSALSALRAEVSAIGARLGAVEQILKDVG